MKWLSLLLALIALPALAQVPPSPPPPTNATKAKLVSPKYAEHVISLAPTFHVRRVKDLGAAKLILYQPTSKTSKLAIPGRKGIVPFAAPQPNLLQLVWNWVDTYSSQPGYPPNYVTNIQFEIYSATALTNFPVMGSYNSIPNNFSLFGTTWWPNMSFTLSPDQAHLFFINRARDTWANLPGQWNKP